MRARAGEAGAIRPEQLTRCSIEAKTLELEDRGLVAVSNDKLRIFEKE